MTTSALSRWTASLKRTSGVGAFRARTSASPERVLGFTKAPARPSGGSGTASFAWLDRASSSWRTWQLSLAGGWETYSSRLPKRGTMRSGILSERGKWARPIAGTGCSSSPTWQTPVSDDAVERKAGKWNSRGEPKLSAQVMWPTPSVCGNYNRKGASATSGDGLATAVSMWPTPCSRDYRSGMSEALLAKRAEERPNGVNLAEEMQRRNGPGQLNPTWLEWLMGFPSEWTASAASATPSSRRSRKSSGGG